MVGSIISAGASIIGASKSAKAAKSASDAQVQAAQIASDTERELYNQGRADMFPGAAAGYTAQNQLMQLLGLGTLGQSIKGAGQYTTNVPQVGANAGTQATQTTTTQTPATTYVIGTPLAGAGPNDVSIYLGQLKGWQDQLARMKSGGDTGGAANIQAKIDAVQRELTKNGVTTAPVVGKVLPNPTQATPTQTQTTAAGTTGAAAVDPMNITNYLTKLPGYQFRLDQGTKALGNAASAQGLTNSGSQLKALTRYGQDYATGIYDDYLNRLASMAGIGQSTSNSMAGNAMQLGGSLGNNAISAGNARASGYAGQSNAWTNALSNSNLGNLGTSVYNAASGYGAPLNNVFSNGWSSSPYSGNNIKWNV